jgi:hypothetical protein
MTFEVQATVICDRCKVAEVIPASGDNAFDNVRIDLPSKWLLVAVAWDFDPTPKHLCERCRRGFEFWINGMADAVLGDEVLDDVKPVKPVVPPGPRPGPNPFV